MIFDFRLSFFDVLTEIAFFVVKTHHFDVVSERVLHELLG